MTLEEFGAILRAEREKQGLSLTDIANALKIPAHTIAALEEGDIEHFPHMAYAKGFLRSYGTYLRLSQDIMAQAHAVLLREIPLEPKTRERNISQGIGSLLPQFLVIFLILAILGGAGYLVWQRGYVQECVQWVTNMSKSLMTPKPKEEKEKNASAPKQETKQEEVQPKEVSEVKEPARLPQPSPQPVQVERQPEQSSVISISTQEEKPSLVTQQANGGMQQVIVIATENCWIQSTVDKGGARQLSLRKGDTFSLLFREDLELKLGNAGGVRFRYNGKDLEPVGRVGQVKTIRFPSQEIQ